MDELHPILYARPGMYLANYDIQLSAASLCYNFLDAVMNSPDIQCHGPIDIVVAGPHFVLTAAACTLDTEPRDGPDILELFNGGGFYLKIMERMSSGIKALAPLVWYTESCLVTLPAASGSYRQAFWHGRPVAPMSSPSTTSDNPAPLSFCLTLPTQLFASPVLERARLQHVLALWRTYRRAADQEEGHRPPWVHWHWREQDPYHYSLRVVLQHQE